MDTSDFVANKVFSIAYAIPSVIGIKPTFNGGFALLLKNACIIGLWVDVRRDLRPNLMSSLLCPPKNLRADTVAKCSMRLCDRIEAMLQISRVHSNIDGLYLVPSASTSHEDAR